MRPSRGMGFLVLTLVGVSGCAGMPRRGTSSSPMEAPTAAAAPAKPSGWRGWWSRWSAPAATPARARAATFDPNLPVETSGRVVPETNIWPDRSRSPFSRLLPTLGQNQPTPKMTAAEANEAIARLAHPRKTDDQRVLPVGLWVDADGAAARPTSAPSRRPAFDGEPAASERPEPIPASSLLLERLSTQPKPKLDPDAQSASTAERTAAVDPAEDTGPPPLVSQASDSEPSPAPSLVALAQTPPPPPLRPSPRVEETPPPSTVIERTPPAAPAVVEPVKSDESAESVEPAESAAPQRHTPEPPSSSLPAAPSTNPGGPAAVASSAPAPASAPTPTVQASSPVVAAPQAGARLASGQTLVASRASDVSGPHRWSLLKWFRPHQAEPRHAHHPGVFPSPQGPAELPPVLVPTSYYASLNQPAPARRAAAPAAQPRCVTPSGQCETTSCPPKKECVLLTRLQHRWEQYRQWKHAHVCKHIQSLKDMLSGKNRCEACGGTGLAPTPSPQGFPSAQVPPPAPTPQAQASWSPFHRGL